MFVRVSPRDHGIVPDPLQPLTHPNRHSEFRSESLYFAVAFALNHLLQWQSQSQSQSQLQLQLQLQSQLQLQL